MYRGNTLLGTSNLEYPIVPQARIAGRFLPTPAYAAVSWVFELYSEAITDDDRAVLREYVAERNRLGLELWYTGVRLEAVVDLISTWADDMYIIHVASTDSRLWRGF